MRKVLLSTVAALAGGAMLVLADPAHATQTATVVSPRLPLNVRTGPAVWHPRVRTIPNGAPVAIACQVKGQRINEGTVRITDVWNRLADGTYVSDAWISRPATVPACGGPAVAAAPTTTSGSVASGSTPLNARTGPARANQLLARLPEGTPLALVCQEHGQLVTGSIRTTDMWDRLSTGAYVSDAYVRRSATPPACTAPPVTVPVAAPGWVHPLPGFPASNSFRTKQLPNHIGVDIMAFTGTPIRAAAAGRVLEVVCNITPGASCDQPGSPALRGCGWYVKLGHANGLATIYCHMVRRGAVQVGQVVQPGQIIGYVGSSGNSSAPHLHFEVHVNAPPTGPYNAIDPIPFMRARGVLLDRR
jgi:murein DD-endopeptidase MepM/ murein hydrolase activator NlpD